MKVESLHLPGVARVTHDVFRDDRGAFMETWQARKYAAAGIDREFVQDNWSESRRGVLRGLHYQLTQPQGKLVAVVAGEIFYAVSDRATVLYKCTEFYHPSSERTLLWDDPDLAIAWPLAPGAMPILSAKDAQGSRLAQAQVFERDPDEENVWQKQGVA